MDPDERISTIRALWCDGDLLAIAFADDAFDVVVSTFGAFTADDHGTCVAELVRVCRPGGLVVSTAWARTGLFATLREVPVAHHPQLWPADHPDPGDWADPDTMAAMVAGLPVDVGDLPVHRLGFGAMRITGEGVWGDPPDRDAAIRLLRRAVELGVDLIDTADSYGPFVSEDLIREALNTGGSDPYDGVVIATKAGLIRTGPGEWHTLGRPEYLRFACEMSLRRLQADTIDLYQLHRIDPKVPAEEQFGVLADLQREGKVRHLGLSEVSVEQLDAAREHLAIASVQNRYNLLDRGSEAVLDICTTDGITFLPWCPVAVGDLARPGGPLDELATQAGATPAQLALAWLLDRSPLMLPIPGTSSLEHLEENLAAAEVELTDELRDALGQLARHTD